MTGDLLVDTWRPPALTKRALIRLIGRELRHEQARVFGALVFVVASGAAIAAGPTLVRIALDDGIRAGNHAVLRNASIAYLVVLVGGGLAGGVRTTLMATGGQRLLHRLRLDALAGALRLGLGEFEQARRGDLVARVTSDVEALSSAAAWLVPELTRVVVTLVGGLVAIAVLSPMFALLALIVVPPIAAACRWFHRESQIVYPEYRRRNGALVGHVVESVEGTATVQAHRAEARQLERLEQANMSVVRGFLAGTRMRIRFYASLTLVQSAATATIVVTAALFTFDERVSVGTAAAAALSIAGVFEPINSLTMVLNEVLTARAALVRVAELAAVPEPSGGDATLPTLGALSFANVTFSYARNRAVLHDISFDIRAGERVALVGATGSGKSTMARLAVGLAHPDTGTVRYGGYDLRDAPERARRRRLLLAPQEGFLVEGTIADNARLSAPQLSDEAIADAARRLGMGAWIESLPHGVATEAGAAGGRFSSGERQLVGLLRVVLADPGLVVLDEATSDLDPETEALVATALDAAFAARAVLIIAHRAATAARCDRIVVLDAGRVVQVGTHEELARQDGRYRALWTDADSADLRPTQLRSRMTR